MLVSTSTLGDRVPRWPRRWTCPPMAPRRYARSAACQSYAYGQVILTQAARRPPFFRKRSTSGAGAVRRYDWPGALAAARARP
jgi:hypothetical protein